MAIGMSEKGYGLPAKTSNTKVILNGGQRVTFARPDGYFALYPTMIHYRKFQVYFPFSSKSTCVTLVWLMLSYLCFQVARLIVISQVGWFWVADQGRPIRTPDHPGRLTS